MYRMYICIFSYTFLIIMKLEFNPNIHSKQEGMGSPLNMCDIDISPITQT